MENENIQDAKNASTDNIDYKAEFERFKAKAAIAEKEAIELRKQFADPIKKLGIKPDELPDIYNKYQELNSAASKLEEERARKAGEFDLLLKKRDEQYGQDKAELLKQIEALSASEREIRVQNGLMQALTKANASQAGVELLPKILESRVKLETIDGVRKLRILDEAGEMPMLTKDGKEATLDDLVEAVSGKYPDLFKGVIKGGSGKPPQSNSTGSAKTITKAEHDAMTPQQRAVAFTNGAILIE